MTIHFELQSTSSVVVGLLFTVATPAWAFAYAGAGAVVLMTERSGRARVAVT